MSWRWCFYINLPVGGVALIAITFLLKASPPLGSEGKDRSWRGLISQTLRMDWIGAVLVLGSVTCLVLGLQWGGNTKPWNSAAVIVTLVLSVVIAAALVMWQRYLQDRAMVPPAIFKSFSIFAIVGYSFCVRFCLLLYSYYIPILYQVTRQASATDSGINLLPFMLAVVLSVIIAGQLVGRIGRYWPFLVAGPPILAIGSGLLYTVSSVL